MNSDDTNTSPQNNPTPINIPEPRIENLVELMEELSSPDPDPVEAKLNETSIDDNNGGRIELVDDPGNTTESIKK